MQRALFLTITLLLPLGQSIAQKTTGTSLPLLQPKTTVLGTIRDTTIALDFLPSDASLSPNGRLVAYSTRKDLRIWNVASHTTSVLFAGEVNTFTWSPKGDAIAFSRIDREARDKFLWAIRLDPMTGKATESAKRVGLAAIRYAPRYSPDERFIAYPRQADGKNTYDLAVVPANGGVERVLATGVDLGVKGWSLDGSSIYYRAWSEPTRRASFRVSVSGGAPVRLAHGPPNSSENGWGYANPASGATVAVLAFPENISVSDWSGSNQLVGVRRTWPRGLKVVNIADGRVRELVDSTAEVGEPEWFADGQRLAILVRRNDRTSLSIWRAEGSESRNLPLTLAPAVLNGEIAFGPHLQVSPDGRYAAFVASKNSDVESIELVDLSSGKQRSVLEVSADTTAPEGKGIGQLMWSPDSKSIRYMYGIWAPELRSVHEVTLDGTDKLVRALPRSAFPMDAASFPTSGAHSAIFDANVVELFGGSSLTLLPLDGSGPRVIYRGSVIGAGALSPDRQTFAVRAGAFRSRERTQTITFVSMGDESQRDVRLPFIEIPGIFWHPEGRRVFMLGRDTAGAPINLYSVPVDGAAPKKVVSLGSNREEATLAVSPNGGMVAFTVAGTPTATLMRLDFDVSSVIKAGAPK